MKSKLALLFLCFSIIVSGCKKEKNPEDRLAATKKEIIGTWQVQSSTETFYDASGKVVSSHDAGLTDLQFKINANSINSNSTSDGYPYTLSNADNKVNLQADKQSYQVTINNDTMIWSFEQEYQQQPNYVKSIFKIQFKRL